MRNISQVEEQEKTPERELNEVEASILSDMEFKTQVIKMLNKHKGRIDNLTENINKEIISIKMDIETIKKRTSQK